MQERNKNALFLLAEVKVDWASRHDGHHIAKMGNLADESANEIAVMDVELASTRGRVSLGHVLFYDLARLRPLHEHRAEVADERREHIALGAIQRVGAPDGVCLLAERTEKAAHHFGLTIEVHQSLLERPGQPHVVVELQHLLA